MKLFAAIAFALFPMTAPVAAPAQSPDVTLLTALCQDDYYEDTAGRCASISAGELLTVEAILELNGVAIVTDDELVVFFDDPEDTPIGSILPRNEGSADEQAVVTDEESKAPPATETVAAKMVPAEPKFRSSKRPMSAAILNGIGGASCLGSQGSSRPEVQWPKLLSSHCPTLR
jgi:hypothetical protein